MSKVSKGSKGSNAADEGKSSRTPAGIHIVKVRTPFGNDREVRLLDRRGPGIFGETCDEGPQQMMLVRRTHVHPESIDVFDRFMGCS